MPMHLKEGLVPPPPLLLQINQAFPKGQQSNVSFKWRDYSPAVFQHLREIFGLESHDYLLSLAGDRCCSGLALISGTVCSFQS